jgi:N-acetylmuramoyl-L-alanine amidase
VAENELPGTDLARDSPTREIGRHLAVTAGVAALLATVLTAWRPASLDPAELVGQLLAADAPQSPAEQPAAGLLSEAERLPIGVVAGHSGLHPDSGLEDPGAVCDDGLTELQVNTAVAELVMRGLEGAGLEAVLLQEWDQRLTGFRGLALISIHADSCQPINETATGYKVAAALETAVPDRSQRLVACIADRYGRATGMRFHPNSVTLDMTEYHSFYEIHGQTPAAIIEVGFLYLDRGFLSRNPDVAARGIVEGLLCYVNNEPAVLPLESPSQ